MNTAVGAKVRVKVGEHAGARGVVAELHGKAVAVQLDGAAVTVTVPIESLTNFSKAARKAWLSQPSRRVGRRSDPARGVSDRTSAPSLEEPVAMGYRAAAADAGSA